MITKEFCEQMIKYMRSNSDLTLKTKCDKIGISVQAYYRACKRHKLDGKVGGRKTYFNVEEALKIMKANENLSDTSEYNSSQDDSE